ncbi:MAG: type II secretion system protein GspJ [Gemmobacter sp.]
MKQAKRKADAGVTLIEVMVSLSLFALIGTAGFAMLDQVLRAQRLTDGRLETLAAMQRAMFVITDDMERAMVRSFTSDATSASVSFQRMEPQTDIGRIVVEYDLADGALRRNLFHSGDQPLAQQILLSDVTSIDWQFHDGRTGWRIDWPPPGQAALPGLSTPNPAAVALTLTLANGQGNLRRVARLPSDAR